MAKSVVVYPRIEEITARKRDGSLWRHKFSRRSAIHGNADGTLTIRPEKAGTRLHKEFPFEGRREPFLVNPPRRRRRARHNPALQIINPPKRKAMSKPRRRRRTRRNPWFEKRRAMSVSVRRAPRHRRAALLGLNRRRARRHVAAKYRALTLGAGKESQMARKRRHRKVAHNPPRRRHFRRRRHNPPMTVRGIHVAQVAKDSAAVAAGIVLPQLALRMPQLSSFADTPIKRGVTKAGLGVLMSMLAKKFLGARAAGMVLVGTGANILLADVLPKAAPGLGLGMADAADPEQFPQLNDLYAPGAALAGGAYGMRDPYLAASQELSEMNYQ